MSRPGTGLLSAVTRRRVVAAVLVAVVGLRSAAALGASAREIDRKVSASIRTLNATAPSAKALAAKAKGVLIFPDIVKAGFIVGAQAGDGALRKGGKTVGYYRTLSASYGFQAGVQSFGYALLFMDDDSLAYLDKSGGWEIGSGPSVVVLDKGMGKSLSTTTLQKGVYAIIFDQKGLMAGIGLQGSKITKIHPSR